MVCKSVERTRIMFIMKRKMDVGQEKDVENAIAKTEQYEAFMEYIAVCNHPEMLDDAEVE